MTRAGSNIAAALAALACACTGTATGDLTVLLEAEDTMELPAGTGDAEIVDGWSVRFDRYVAVVGDVRVARGADPVEVRDDTRLVVDLATLPVGGVVLAELDALDAVRWDHFEYAIGSPAGAERHGSVSAADFAELVANDWAYWLEGELTNPDGESCPPGGACRPATALRFRLAVSLSVTFGPCSAEEGLSGVTVVSTGTNAAVTIHGDHPFFDSFPSGAELVERRAQWLVNADVDGDDVVTTEELAALSAAQLLPSDLYDVSGAPFPVETGLDYLRGQLATQGHFQGEGECPWAVDTDP